jgi:hypothetical protein
MKWWNPRLTIQLHNKRLAYHWLLFDKQYKLSGAYGCFALYQGEPLGVLLEIGGRVTREQSDLYSQSSKNGFIRPCVKTGCTPKNVVKRFFYRESFFV